MRKVALVPHDQPFLAAAPRVHAPGEVIRSLPQAGRRRFRNTGPLAVIDT